MRQPERFQFSRRQIESRARGKLRCHSEDSIAFLQGSSVEKLDYGMLRGGIAL